MENTIVLVALGVAVVVAVVAVVLLQKKAGELQEISDELARVKQERDEKSEGLSTLEATFEEEMDKVVTSTIQKLAHAEKAKEEAVQAAEDNYEVAAEAHDKLREKDEIIKKLQQSQA